jgi:hypothetical protein
LLSAALTEVFSALIGLFWGSGKMPWRLLIVTLLIMAFLNLGKFTMRERYWRPQKDEPQPDITLTDMPHYYGEWMLASVDALTGQQSDTKGKDAFGEIGKTAEQEQTGQNLLTRINNLQNLLYVIDATDSRHIQPLGGATYTLIPPLLVPRVLWPDKPRTHEGQILLNVYYGRQELNATLSTYIAWGLLPEAYGNFGRFTGAIMLGFFIGGLFAWIEKFVARKLLLSMEGFLAFTLFLGMANSYEMVASVLITSLFQAFIPIIIASAPFVERIIPRSPTKVPAEA